MALLSKDFIVKSGLIVQGTTNPVTTSTGNTGTLQVNGGAAFAKDILIGSSATVYGPSVLKSTLNVGGNVDVNDGNFTVNAATGNTYADGTLVVAGVSTVSNIVINGSTGITGLNNNTLDVKAASGEGTRVISDNYSRIAYDSNLYGPGSGKYADVSVNSTDGVYLWTEGGVNGENQLQFGYDGILQLTRFDTSTAKAALEIKGLDNGGVKISDTGDAADANPALNVSAGGAYIYNDLQIDGNTLGSGGVSPLGTLKLTNGGAYIHENVFIHSSGAAGDATPALKLDQGGAYINKDLQLDSTTNGSSVGAGALRVAQGGAYINNDVYIAGSTSGSSGSAALWVGNGGAYINNNLQIDGSEGGNYSGASLYMPNGGAFFGRMVRIESTNDATDSDPALNVNNGGLYVNKRAIIDSTQTATDSPGSDAALKVAGGVWIGDNLIVKSTSADTGTKTSNALYVDGGVWVDKTLVVKGDTTFGGNVIFNGTATYVYSTNTVYTDNIINMHTPNGGDLNNHNWGVDDGKDIGFIFHYYKGADKNGFLGFANDSGYLEWYSDGTETAGGVFTGTSYGTFKTGSIQLVDTTVSSNTITGALIVAGGVGIAGDIYLQDETGTNNKLYGTATQADNLNLGGAGQIPIQTANGVTAFLPAGTADNQVLTWVSSGSTATWASAGATSVGRATTATNIVGPQWSILYQKDTDLTTATSYLQYDADNFALKVNTVHLYTNDTTGKPGDAQNQFVADSGQSIELYSDNYAQLNYNNDSYVWVNTGGAHMSTVGAELTLDTSGNLTLNNTGYFEANYVRPTNLTNGRVVFSDSNHELVDDSGLTYDSGSDTLTVAGAIEVGGTGGDITMTGGNITGVNNITLDGTTGGTSAGGALNVQNGGIYSKKSVYIDSSNDYNNAAPALDVHNGGVNVGLTVGVGGDLKFTSTTGQVVFDSTANLREEDSVALGGSARDLVLDAKSQVLIKTNEAGNEWAFGIDGKLELPNGTKVYDATGRFYVDSLRDDSTATTLVVYNTETKELTRTTTFSNTLTVGQSLIVNGTAASSTSSASAGALQVAGGVGISGGLYVDQNAYVNADLYVQGTLYVQGNSLDGVDQITGSTGTFADIHSTGTIYAHNVKIDTLTATRVPYVGADSLLVDTTTFTWDNANQVLTIGAGGTELGGDSGYGYVKTPTALVGYSSAQSGAKLSVNGGTYVNGAVTSTNVVITSNKPTLAGTAADASFSTQGGVNIQKDLYVGTTATFNTSIYVANDIYLGGNKLSSTSSQFIDITATGSATLNNVNVTGTFTATSLTITSTADSNLNVYGYDLTDTQQSLGVRGGIKALGNVAVGKVLYVGMNDAGDIGGQEPHNKPIDGVFIVNSMQSGGTYNGLTGSWTGVIDSWDKVRYTSAKYMVQITDTGGKIHTQELMVIQDGTNVYMSEYGIVTTQGELGTFGGGFNGSNVEITFTANYSASNMKIQVVRQSIITDIENYC